jgi:hypothetical protein
LFTVLCRRNQTSIGRLGLAISKKHCRRAAGTTVRTGRCRNQSPRRNHGRPAGAYRQPPGTLGAMQQGENPRTANRWIINDS